MALDITDRQPSGPRSVAEVAAAALSPRAVLTARWHKQMDALTALSIQRHDNNDPDRVDLQQAIEEVRRDMRSTEAALDRISHRTYGRCESCGHTIDPLRLVGLPDASVCRRCDRRQPMGTP
jgi:RNA polymerase-binding transcription factor DksA